MEYLFWALRVIVVLAEVGILFSGIGVILACQELERLVSGLPPRPRVQRFLRWRPRWPRRRI